MTATATAPAETTPDAFTEFVQRALGVAGARLGQRLGGGNANITQLVETDDGQRFIVRRPPEAAISPNAARGVSREYQLLSRIADHAPVPRALAFCEDAAVLGTPFVISEFVPGFAITDRLPDGYDVDAGTLTAIGESLIDGLAAVHRIVWQALGLERFGRPENFLARQIERWIEVRAKDQVRDLPLIAELGQWLQDNLPVSPPPTIIHGDYHLDNTLFSETDPKLAAIIDWELSSLGDPLTDLGLVLGFWGARSVEPPGFAFVQAVSRRPGVIDRRDLAQRWSSQTGISVADLDYYRCFALWRLASVVEGAYCLYRRGEVDSAYARGLEYDVPALLDEAAAARDGG